LDFQSRGQDKWRIIHAWLLGADRLSDDWISAAPRIARHAGCDRIAGSLVAKN
jgi:hypothetical protein